jgi:hypothetical protein
METGGTWSLDPNLSKLNYTHRLILCLFYTHGNIIFPFTLRGSMWHLLLDFPSKILYAFVISPMCATVPALSPSLLSQPQ